MKILTRIPLNLRSRGRSSIRGYSSMQSEANFRFQSGRSIIFFDNSVFSQWINSMDRLNVASELKK